ncbi:MULTISPECIES: peptidase MA family metallohydrolase [Geobacter]|uniref:Peptidase MA-like domain-containing protein n=2 Tax=Geobacter TaxID=28231 RepID=A0A0C1TMQ9_9BACT|nr:MULTISPECIES: tetratricopeptide repeat protein [Geobacter]KIE42184.1 hypothetical protein SE37_05895 [Geobacter soli]
MNAIQKHRLRFTLPLLLGGFMAAVPPATGADPIAQNNYGVQLIERGEVEKAIEQLEQAFSLFSLDPTLRDNLAAAHALLGRKLLESKSYGEAARHFGRGSELYPDEPRFHLLRGIAFSLAKNGEMARYELSLARSLGGDTAEGLYFLGKTYYDTGETDQAMALWEKAANLAPSESFLAGLLEKVRREQSVEERMERGHSSRFIVSYDSGTKTGSALAILDLLEEFYNSVGTDVGYFPASRIPVILYTRQDYREVTRSPHWSGGLYDGKIRLPVGGITEITPDIRATLRHEYAHAVVIDLTRGNCPTWLNEGIAEIQGRLEYSPPLGELGKAAKRGEFLPLKRLEGSFAGLEGNEVRLAYEQSYSLVNFIVSAHGWHRVRMVLEYLGNGLPLGKAMNRAFADVGLDYDGLFAQWRDHALREFGGGDAPER